MMIKTTEKVKYLEEFGTGPLERTGGVERRRRLADSQKL